jgi:hypothetical protein
MHGKPLIEKVPRYIKKYTDFFADLCLQDYRFQQFAPSLLAAAIVAAARRALNIEPVWRTELIVLTDTKEPDAQKCFTNVRSVGWSGLVVVEVSYLMNSAEFSAD